MPVSKDLPLPNELENTEPEIAEESGVEPETEALKAPRCPNCGWQDVRPSRVRGFLDSLLGMVSMRPYRCRSCGKRFHRFGR